LKRKPISRPRVLVLCLAGVLAAFVLVQRLRGPELPGYRIESRPLVQNVVATGRVISTSRVQVGSEITATVRERRVKEGDAVRPADVLIVLSSDDLAARVREAEAALRQLEASTRPQQQAALRQAEAQLAQASRERKRREELLEQNLYAREATEQAQEAEKIARAAADRARLATRASGPGQSEEMQLRERLQAAKAQLAKAVIRSGVAGTVLTRNVEPGDLVQPGKVLLEIAREGDTEIEVPVDEKNLAVLRVGQVAQGIADAFPDQPFPATVNFISPSIDAQRGTVNIRLKVEPVPDFLRQDMTVSVTVETGRRDAALVVPNDALLEAGGDGPAVAVVRDGRLRRVPVQLGLRSLALTEIVSGLAAGDWVLAASSNPAGVADGSRVRVSKQALPGGDTASSTRREMPVRFD
jgi:HlyD family secretion protein